MHEIVISITSFDLHIVDKVNLSQILEQEQYNSKLLEIIKE